jgi:hypothetical protein
MILPAVMNRTKSLGPVLKAARDDSSLIGGLSLAIATMPLSRGTTVRGGRGESAFGTSIG